MSRIVKNNTTSTVVLNDLLGARIASNDFLDLGNVPDLLVRTSLDLITNIVNGNLTYTDGAQNFTPNDAVNLIRGYQQLFASTTDGRLMANPTNRPNGTFAYYTGASDDVSNNKIGKGTSLLFQVAPGQSQTQVIQFTEIIYFCGTTIFFKDADFGCTLDVTVYAPPNTPIPVGTGGNYDLVNGQYVPNAANTGTYFMAPVWIPVNKFINGYNFFGDQGQINIQSPDVARLFQGWQMKVTFTNPSTTKTLQIAANVNMYRIHSV